MKLEYRSDRMSVLVETYRSGGMTMADETKWAEEAARRIAAQRNAAKTEKEAALAEREMINAAFPELWQQTREAVKRRSDLLNQAAKEHIVELHDAPNEIKIVVAGYYSATLEARPEQAAIEAHLTSSGETYKVRVAQRQAILTHGRNQNQGPASPEEVAEHVLNHLISFVR